MKTEFNILSGKWEEQDKDLFFGPLSPQDEFLVVTEPKLMAHLLNQLGLFNSVSNARKNGWDKPIPNGFSDFVIGKLNIRVTILNIQ